MVGVGLDNVFVERLWWSVKYEHVYRHDNQQWRPYARGWTPIWSSSIESVVIKVWSTRHRGTCIAGK